MKTIKMSRRVAERLRWSVSSFIALFISLAVMIWTKCYDCMMPIFLVCVSFNIYLIMRTLVEKGWEKWMTRKS